jgi:CRP-like cAMP-binding protein
MDVERLRRLPLFAELDHHDLSALARMAREVDVRGGELIVEQDAMPYELFVIEEGSAEVVRDDEPIADLGPGDVFGEMGMLRLQRRSASVRATSRVRAVALDSADLAAMSERMPELVERLRETMARRERENEP